MFILKMESHGAKGMSNPGRWKEEQGEAWGSRSVTAAGKTENNREKQ